MVNNFKISWGEIWTEKIISRHLFGITAVISVAAMAMLALSFFTKGDFPPPSLGILYLGVLLIYSLHKEMLRWLKEPKKVERKGEVFVYAWVSFTFLLYILDFATKGVFTDPQQDGVGGALSNATTLTIEILAIFILTRAFKLLRRRIPKKK